MSDRLKDDKDIVLEAVKNQGSALQFASDSLKEDKEVCMTAESINGFRYSLCK